jgi:alanyl-tRNA synthetase
VDLRDDADKKKIPGCDLVNNDHPQVIEIWNNVFMQFNRKADSSLENLPSTHVDTGMGLERLAMALQGKQSNYDTDLFQTLIQHMVKVSGISYGKSEETDIALRVIADHVRTIAFSIADGQLPANNGAGYVIRRILRRAVRYGYQTLGLKESFLSDLSLVLCELMGDPYQELIAQKDIISKVIREEENSFFRTLELGIKRMELLMNECKAQNQPIIAGNAVFELYDTYGFPVDLTSLIARENGLSIDEQAFDKELQIQKDRSRAATAVETADWVQVNPDETTEFIGYDHTSAEVRIIKYRKVSQKQKDFFQLVLNQTPFYPEGGGQVGDKGILRNDTSTISIFDTKKENNLIIHLTEKIPVDLSGVFTAQIDIDKRQLSADNHSATHLLHHALRSVLGNHVEQKGSLVNPDYLRFDFSHFAKITDEELALVEAMVTKAIHSNIPLEERRAVPIEEAKKLGAMALFGEKYGDSVRVIKFGDSVELCGGIHVPSTGKIGIFKITSEAAVAAGIRRIEAITGPSAERYFKEKAATLDQLSALLKNPQNIQKSVLDLIEKNNELTKSLEQFQREKSKAIKAVLSTKISTENGIQFLGEIVDLDSDSVKDILFQLKSETDNFVGVIGNKDGAKCTLSLIISENLVKDKGWDASKLIRSAAQHIQGGGGGQNFFATAGGKLPSGLSMALSDIKLLLAQ